MVVVFKCNDHVVADLSQQKIIEKEAQLARLIVDLAAELQTIQVMSSITVYYLPC